MSFEPGDLVQIKSGSPALVVTSIDADGVHCLWHSEMDDAVKTATIPEIALALIDLSDLDHDEDDDHDHKKHKRKHRD